VCLPNQHQRVRRQLDCAPSVAWKHSGWCSIHICFISLLVLPNARCKCTSVEKPLQCRVQL